VDRLIDDLRRLVEEERDDPQPADGAHEQAERLRWRIANLVMSTMNEHAALANETSQPDLRALASVRSPSHRRLRREAEG
jgi:hypothetical protein